MERYGTIPDRFTKEWWKYFWTYYKWQTIIIALSIIFLTSMVLEFTTKIKYDTTVTYIGKAAYPDGGQKAISKVFEELSPDINENGRVDAVFQIISIDEQSPLPDQGDYIAAVETKKILEIQAGEGFLFIMDRPQALKIAGVGMAEVAFSPLSEWLDDKFLNLEHAPDMGEEYFVKIPNNNFFKEYGFDAEEIYIGIRAIRSNEDAELAKKRYETAVKIAEYIIDF